MDRAAKPIKPWRASILPNGVWEIIEYTFFLDKSFTYRTVVRGITRDQAKTLEAEHNKAIENVSR